MAALPSRTIDRWSRSGLVRGGPVRSGAVAGCASRRFDPAGFPPRGNLV